MSSQQRHEVEPETWAEWNVMVDDQLCLFDSGQAWIKTDYTVEVRP